VTHRVRVAAIQAEPRRLGLAAGVGQVVELIAEAARGGADPVAFPETFLPGYPWWIWLDSPARGMRFVARYSANSMTGRGGDGTHRDRGCRPAEGPGRRRRLEHQRVAEGRQLTFGEADAELVPIIVSGS
jgi:hypothetical protein